MDSMINTPTLRLLLNSNQNSKQIQTAKPIYKESTVEWKSNAFIRYYIITKSTLKNKTNFKDVLQLIGKSYARLHIREMCIPLEGILEIVLC